MNVVVFERDNRSPQPPGGRYLVSSFYFAQHGLPFFLAALLRHDQDKVEDSENKDEGRDPQPARTATGLQNQAVYIHVMLIPLSEPRLPWGPFSPSVPQPFAIDRGG